MTSYTHTHTHTSTRRHIHTLIATSDFMEPVHARSKAAAWAWYQRGSGSPAALATAQSEAASRGTLSTRFVRGAGSPSRFKLEAEFLLSNYAPINDVSDRLKSLHLLPAYSSNSTSSCGSDVAMSSTGLLAASSNLNLIGSAALDNTEELAIAMSRFSYGTASWDCGSALFDSFELVAMSKKLDDAHQLIQGTLEKVCPQLQYKEDSSTDACGQIDTITEGANEEEAAEEEEEGNNGVLYDHCKQSRQAIYDMFCRYDNLTTAPGAGSVCDEEHIRKQSTSAMSPSARSSKQYRRRRLHSLSKASKAFRHHLMQLTGQSRMRPWSSTHHVLLQPPDESCRLQSASSLPAKGYGFQASSPSPRKQYSSDGGHHHHHHHHYHRHHHHHFLYQQLHSDADGFGVLPVVTPQLMGTSDKSHLVAAAGLRASKVSSLQDYLLLNSKPELGAVLDAKSRWGDESCDSVASAMESLHTLPI